ncbi:MAG: hypothetical protein K0Q72_2241, partial [Armatimonadetes bacterium]|nr:hypothetical protein [Armatimonadota bacterium]
RDAGLRVDVVAEEYTVPGLIAALEAHWGQNKLEDDAITPGRIPGEQE